MKTFLLFTGLCLGLFSSLKAQKKEGEEKPEKQFSLLSPEKTNVNFNNAIEDTKDHSILIYSNYYGGAGVGVGDINNDGLPDLFFAGNLVGDKLYLNKGNLQFEDITREAGIIDNGGWSSGVLFADINKDGFVDIYVTRELYDDQPELRRNKLYINNGDNTFTESAAEYGIDNDERTRHAVFFDYDNDGDLDLFLLNQPPNPGDYSKFYDAELLLEKWSARLYQNRGDKFTDVTKEAGLLATGFPNSVTASDLNGDGWTDLFVANDFWVRDWVYINNGDGTFTDKAHEYLRHMSLSSMGVDAGDINNNGLLDVVVVDMLAEDPIRRKSNMGGMKKKEFWKTVKEGNHYQYMFNMLHLNIGNGHFSDIAHIADVAATDWSWSSFFADFDNDGWKDLFITNGLMHDIRDLDASNDFPRFVETELQKYISKNPNPGNVTVWDVVDMEKALDLSPSVKLANYIYRNNGDLTFSKKTFQWGMDHKTFSHGAAYADLDDDGDLDIIISNVNDIASIYENHANEFLNTNYLRIKPVPDGEQVTAMGVKVWIETGREQQFFEVTNVRGMYSTSEHIAHFGLGDKEIVDKIRIRWTDGKKNELTKVKANQTLEVNYSESVLPVRQPDKTVHPLITEISNEIDAEIIHRENNFDDFQRQLMLPYKLSTQGPYIAAGDVNGDGLEDFYLGGAVGYPGRLFLQQSDLKFEEFKNSAFESDKLSEDTGAAFFDFDGDGDLDLYVVSGGNEFKERSKAYQDRLYLNDGNGKFTKAEEKLPPMNFSGSVVYPQDYDKDGDIDLFVGGRHVPWSYPEPASSVLLQNENGSFVDVTSTIAAELMDIGMVTDASWVDFNGDGLVDLVVVGEWMPVTFFQNMDGTFKNVTRDYGLDQHTGWWFSIESVDMDNDGDQDFIAGNLGLNYKYKASFEDPFEIYYYDFDNNGINDIVFTHQNFDEKYPIAGLSRSAEQVTVLNSKYKTYHEFAASSIYEVYGKNNLKKALHYNARTFASMYIENLGNGRFKFHQLPNAVQLSSINDLIIDDFNDDGNLDILVAGNLYEAEVETVRNDAGYGMLLVGDGSGGFRPLTPEESGFFVPENVKSLSLLNAQGGKLILTGCNDTKIKVFRLNGKSEF